MSLHWLTPWFHRFPQNTLRASFLPISPNALTIYETRVLSHHSLFVDLGRRAGKRPPISAILQWIDDKRIVPTDISKTSLAFLIARKIGNEGWKPKNSYPNGVISSVINQNEIDKLLISLSKVAATNIRTEVWQTLG